MKLTLRNFFSRGFTARRAGAQVWKEKVRCRDMLQPACRLHLAVKRQETEWLVWLAVDQVIKIMADSRQSELRQGDRRFVRRQLLLLDGLKHRLDRLGKLRDPVKANDGQRTLNLVQVSPAEFKLRQVSGISDNAGLVLL